MRNPEPVSLESEACIMCAFNYNIEPYDEDFVIRHRRFGSPGRAGLVPARDQHPAWQLYDWRSAVGDQRRDRAGDWWRTVLVRTVPMMEETLQIGDRVEVY